MLVSLVAGLVVAVHGGDPGPVAPVDTAPGTLAQPATSLPVATSLPATEPSLVGESDPPSSAPLVFGPGDDPDDRVSPFSRTVEQAVGVRISDLFTGLRRAEQRAVFDCVNAAGWVMTGADLDWVRTDTLDEYSYPMAGTHASTELFDDERRRRAERSTLRGDTGFETVLSDCAGAQNSLPPDLRNLVSNVGGLPSFDVGDDPTYLAAQARFGACLMDLDLTKDSLQAAYDALALSASEAQPKLEGDSEERSAAVDALEALDRQERELDDRVAPCVNAIERTETELVYERQIEFLDENPGYIEVVLLDSISVASVLDTIDDIAAASDRVELTATDPTIDLTASVDVPARLSSWQFEAVGSDASFEGSEPRRQPIGDPTLILLPFVTGDPNSGPWVAFTPEFDERPTDVNQLTAQSSRPERQGETGRRLIDQQIGRTRVVLYESTVVDVVSSRTLPVAFGYLATAGGQVFKIDARDVGIDTVIQIAATLRVTP